MTDLWRSIGATRLTDGRLWTPRLSLDMMARDWATFGTPIDYGYTVDSYGYFIDDPPLGWVDAFPIYMVFPESWDVDESYAVHLVIDIYINLHYTLSGGANPTMTARLTANGTSVSVPQTVSAPRRLLLAYGTDGGLPTGETTLQIQVNGTGGTELNTATVYAQRAYGASGPDSGYYFLISS